MTLPLHQRQLLLDAVRPPSAMALDAAVGTTFTLDLLALLAIPVAIAFRQEADLADGEDERVDVIESVRQSADRTLIFCQTGLIGVPRQYRPAFVWTEESVVEVVRPSPGRLFHPKVWVLRFSGGGTTHHRVLVMSRNLTFDRSWDVIARFDEDSAATATMDTTGLKLFLTSLPAFAKTRLDRRRAALLMDLTRSVAAAPMAVPPEFAGGEFWPLGGAASRGWPFAHTCDNSLAVSPFLSSAAAERFTSSGTARNGLVSRSAGLGAVAATLDGVAAYEMKSAALSAELSELKNAYYSEPDATGVEEASTPLSLRGLHAKMYVQDTGQTASIWIGSANLTDAAFSGNVELLARLTGNTTTMGVDQLMGFDQTDRLHHLLTEFVGDTPDDPEDEEGLDLLDHLAIDLGEGRFVTTVSASSQDQYALTVSVSNLPALPAGVAMEVRPLSLARHFLELDDGHAAWEDLALTRLTPFVVVRLSSRARRREFVVRSVIVGDPPHRRSAVLAACIRNTEDFLRYLGTLLGYDLSRSVGPGEGSGGHWVPGIREDRILEDLLTTAAREPKRLQFLDGLLTELDKSQEGVDIVPAEFRAVWKSVRITVSHHWDRGSRP